MARSTTITVVYSTGPDTVELPSGMVGRPADPLIDEIRLLGVNIIRYDETTEDAEPGTVLRTQPLGGSTVRPGDTIDRCGLWREGARPSRGRADEPRLRGVPLGTSGRPTGRTITAASFRRAGATPG